MAQVLGKKAMVGKDNVTRSAVAKGMEETAGKNTKARSKNKIPKALRFDLENALVNLCDVWFEEIKPHLLRNNVKLHVHGDPAGGEGRKRLPPGAPGCSHLDPGAASDQQQRRDVSCADCYPMQRTASKALCRKPPPLHTSPPRQRPSAPPTIQNQSRSGNEETKRRSRKRRKVRKQTQSETRLRIPRLCNILSSESKSYQINRKSMPYQNNNTSLKSNNKCLTKNKYTQTYSSCIASKNVSTMPRSPRIDMHQSRGVPSNRHKKNRTAESPLFKKDLVDIVCSEHEKRLEVIYKSPTKSEVSSVMNFIPIAETQGKKYRRKKVNQPWK